MLTCMHTDMLGICVYKCEICEMCIIAVYEQMYTENVYVYVKHINRLKYVTLPCMSIDVHRVRVRVYRIGNVDLYAYRYARDMCTYM